MSWALIHYFFVKFWRRKEVKKHLLAVDTRGITQKPFHIDGNRKWNSSIGVLRERSKGWLIFEHMFLPAKSTSYQIEWKTCEWSDLLEPILWFSLRKTASICCKKFKERTILGCITLSQACLRMEKNQYYQANTDYYDEWCCFTYASPLQLFEKSSSRKYISVLKQSLEVTNSRHPLVMLDR